MSAAMPEDVWLCANYSRPVTCLTAPSSESARCDWCRTQATPQPSGGALTDEDIRQVHPDYPTHIPGLNALQRHHAVRVAAHFAARTQPSAPVQTAAEALAEAAQIVADCAAQGLGLGAAERALLALAQDREATP